MGKERGKKDLMRRKYKHSSHYRSQCIHLFSRYRINFPFLSADKSVNINVSSMSNVIQKEIFD